MGYTKAQPLPGEPEQTGFRRLKMIGGVENFLTGQKPSTSNVNC